MFVKAEIFVDDKKFNLLEFFYRYTQPTNHAGMPNGNVRGGYWTIVIEKTGNPLFTDWAASPTMMKSVKIMVYPAHFGKRYTFELYDVFCVSITSLFNANNTEPMKDQIVLSPAQLAVNGEMQHQKLWKITDVGAEAEATSVAEDEPKFLGYYFEDENEKRIEQKKIKINQNFYLIIETENAEGESITININDDRLDYKYNGKVLEKDTLKGINITGEQTKIPLTAIAQQN